MQAASGPLAGIRVVAVEQAVAVPLCTRHMAELGADVIKIERPVVGDFARAYDTSVNGLGAHFVWLNHGKRSLEVDISDDEGRGLLLELLASADVLVSNLAPGSIDRIVPQDRLDEVNPRLVHCQVDGYGRGGPYEHRKAYDLLVQGEGGVTANTGTPDAPAKPGVSLADLGAGTYALAAIMIALRERDATGRGKRVHVSLFDVVTEWMMPLLLAERYGGGAPPPAGTHHASIVPYGAFTASCGRTLNIAVQNERQWELFCREVLEEPSLLSEPRFVSNEARLNHREEVVARVAEEVGRIDLDTLTARLNQAGIPWGRLNGLRDVVEHEQLTARGRWREVELPGSNDTGPVHSLASPLDDLMADGAGARAVPELGAHTTEILKELGLDTDRRKQLLERGVVGVAARHGRDTDG